MSIGLDDPSGPYKQIDMPKLAAILIHCSDAVCSIQECDSSHPSQALEAFSPWDWERQRGVLFWQHRQWQAYTSHTAAGQLIPPSPLQLLHSVSGDEGGGQTGSCALMWMMGRPAAVCFCGWWPHTIGFRWLCSSAASSGSRNTLLGSLNNVATKDNTRDFAVLLDDGAHCAWLLHHTVKQLSLLCCIRLQQSCKEDLMKWGITKYTIIEVISFCHYTRFQEVVVEATCESLLENIQAPIVASGYSSMPSLHHNSTLSPQP